MTALLVYMNGTHIGLLAQENGRLSFVYVDQPSASLAHQFPMQVDPFTHEQCEAFFSGLLPDEPVRSNLARLLKVSPRNTFGLLQHLGGDCAGAIQVLPRQTAPNEEQSLRRLSDDELYSILQKLPQRPLGIGIEGFRISGAGAQDKLVIAKIDGRWCLPLYGYPSTHMIKPNIQGFSDSVLNEYFCMTLAGRVGIRVPAVDIITLHGHQFYAVERYDRVHVDNQILRLHQEDFCQLLNIPPNQKYQNEGGPSIPQLFETIQIFQRQGRMKGAETLHLLQLVLFNFLIGNGDAHGKNFSILYTGTQIEVAPGYDLLSTLVYGGYHTEKMAMKIGSKYKFKAVANRHLDDMAESIGISPKLVQRQGKKLVDIISRESKLLLAEMTQQGFTSAILEEIDAVIQKQRMMFRT
jgi:serine/threonine-protein kinase HipA